MHGKLKAPRMRCIAYMLWLSVIYAIVIATATATENTKWTTLPRSDHPSGVPVRTSSGTEVLHLLKRDGAALLTGMETDDPGLLLHSFLSIFESEGVVAAQAPMHVGTNNFGFRGGVPITNLERRPPHVDTIANKFTQEEAPDVLILCARRAASDGGGESYLVDLPAAIRRMTPSQQTRLHQLEVVQRTTLIAGFDQLGTNRTDVTQGPKSAPTSYDRVERLVLPNPHDVDHPCIRFSSFIETIDESDNTRPVATSNDPEADMASIRAYVQSVGDESAEAARFLMAPGECQVVDNYRTAHGREPYTDLGRALWQIWIWSRASLKVPDNPGPGRSWVVHPNLQETMNKLNTTCDA